MRRNTDASLQALRREFAATGAPDVARSLASALERAGLGDSDERIHVLSRIARFDNDAAIALVVARARTGQLMPIVPSPGRWVRARQRVDGTSWYWNEELRRVGPIEEATSYTTAQREEQALLGYHLSSTGTWAWVFDQRYYDETQRGLQQHGAVRTTPHQLQWAHRILGTGVSDSNRLRMITRIAANTLGISLPATSAEPGHRVGDPWNQVDDAQVRGWMFQSTGVGPQVFYAAAESGPSVSQLVTEAMRHDPNLLPPRVAAGLANASPEVLQVAADAAAMWRARYGAFMGEAVSLEAVIFASDTGHFMAQWGPYGPQPGGRPGRRVAITADQNILNLVDHLLGGNLL